AGARFELRSAHGCADREQRDDPRETHAAADRAGERQAAVRNRRVSVRPLASDHAEDDSQDAERRAEEEEDDRQVEQQADQTTAETGDPQTVARRLDEPRRGCELLPAGHHWGGDGGRNAAGGAELSRVLVLGSAVATVHAPGPRIDGLRHAISR